MIFTNFKLFFRNAMRFKSVFLINIIGLSAGLACTLFISLWINEELGVDKFHENDDQLYQVMIKSQESNGISVYNNTPPVLFEAFKNDIPEIEYAVPHIYDFEKNVLSVDNKNFKLQGVYTGVEYFEMFSYRLIHGKRDEVLKDINNIVISKELAISFFGTSEGVLGKTILFNSKHAKQVSGVFSIDGENASSKYDYVLPFESLFVHIPRVKKSWNNNFVNTYIQIKKGTSKEVLEAKVENIIAQNTNNKGVLLFLRPFSDKYLYDNFEDGVQTGGRIEYVKIFGLIAFFILLIACINFINLSTANASRRMLEIGVKKVMGAKRKVLMFQFFGESILTVLLASLIAIIMVLLLLPQFNEIAGKQIFLKINTSLFFMLFGIVLIAALLAGSYPAIYLSKLDAIKVLKGKLSTGLNELLIRKGFVVFQFGLSVILIAAVMVISQQMEFIQGKDLGYNKENVIAFKAEGKSKIQLDDFLYGLNRISGVKYASSMFKEFIGEPNSTGDLNWQGKEALEVTEMQYQRINFDMFELLGIKMKSGRPFSREFSTDSLKIIFNESAIALMGMKEPIGKMVDLWNEKYEILGVVENFHTESLQQEVKPMLIICNTKRTSTIMVKIEGNNVQETLHQIEQFHSSYNPGFPFEYKFIDDDFAAQYASEHRVASLSKYFAGLAIIISCLGLFGLGTFTAENRRKEVGVRRALGQSRTGITILLTTEFVKLVSVAILIGLPIAFLLSRNWLSGFAYKIDLKIWYFLLAGFVAILVALLTVISQTIRAAYKNPIDALKEE